MCLVMQAEIKTDKILLKYSYFMEWENGNPLQYSFLENPMDRGAWLAIVYGISNSQT